MKRLCTLLIAILSSTVLFAQAVEQDVAIKCDWGTISATLATSGSDTVVIIVAGSGPTDRNGNSQLNLSPYSYKLLSDGLVGECYDVLRYDKRAIGRSVIPAESIPNLLLDDYVDDVVCLVDYLRGAGYKRIFIAGHSEGGLIALIVAARGVEVDGLILLATPGYAMDEILRTQLTAQLMPQYWTLMIRADNILRRLKSGQRVATEDIPKELMSLFNPTVQPFIINSMQYDPQLLAKQVDCPMLVVSGGHDIQVSKSNGEAIANSAPNAEYVVYDKMTHVLKDWASSERMEQLVNVYINSHLPLTDGLVAKLSEFLKTTK